MGLKHTLSNNPCPPVQFISSNFAAHTWLLPHNSTLLQLWTCEQIIYRVRPVCFASFIFVFFLSLSPSFGLFSFRGRTIACAVYFSTFIVEMGTFLFLSNRFLGNIVLGVMCGKIFHFIEGSERPINTFITHFAWFVVGMWLSVIVGWHLALFYYIWSVGSFWVHQRFFRWSLFSRFFLFTQTNFVFFLNTGWCELIQSKRFLWKVLQTF